MADAPVKYFADQYDDENVLYVFRHHPIVMRKGIIAWAIGTIIGPLYITVLTYAAPDSVTIGKLVFYTVASFIFGCILMSPSYIGWYFSLFIMTDQRFIQIKQKGLFHRSVSDIGLQQIQSVNYRIEGLNETLLGFGTIEMQTYLGNLEIKEVHHPAKIQKKIARILRDQGVTGAPQSYQPAQQPLDEEEA